MKPQRAIISTWNKDKIVDLASVFQKLGIQILATAGTAKYLKEHRIRVLEVSEFTQSEEILGGRVKTLHPKILGGILTQRVENNILPIDIVVVNLYPFEEGLRRNLSLKEMIELIDIGGVTLLRSAAKNYEYVTAVPHEKYYSVICEELLKTGEIPPTMREFLAAKAFEIVAHYESVIAEYFSQKFLSLENRDYYCRSYRKDYSLRYGENPHQKGFYCHDPFSKFKFTLLQGKELSYNNLLDLDTAISLVQEFSAATCAIIKHGTPCGVASAFEPQTAYENALKSDEQSAFGGIVGFNCTVDKEIAQQMIKIFLEVIAAPNFDSEAQEILRKKKNLRLVKYDGFFNNIEIRSALGGILVQERDMIPDDTKQWKVVSERQPTAAQLEELAFAFKVCKYVKSNGIVISKNKTTIGIGGGQTSRVEAVKIALKKAQNRIENAVLASDGFFPFRDSIDLAAEYGIKAIAEPGGSINDQEVISAANEHNISLVFTNVRHFRH
jgi:phosphoribosylaminoimidazolecarboxamide formyltransferase/IMP cyclohydrolase